VSTPQIHPTVHDYPVCEVCGRTVLRGERVSIYINGSARRSVCELCETRALHEGWVREGNVPAFQASGATTERRRSIFGRRRSRRGAASSPDSATATWEQGTSASSWARSADGDQPPAGRGSHRHVHAVPSSDGQRTARAVELFNRSEHRRTVSGVSRSLGLPLVSVSPVQARPSLVSVVVSWELCWYRYEVDLSDDGSSVRVAAQGYDLDDLEERERMPNAVADEFGKLTLE
jgi:hypothetical protein